MLKDAEFRLGLTGRKSSCPDLKTAAFGFSCAGDRVNVSVCSVKTPVSCCAPTVCPLKRAKLYNSEPKKCPNICSTGCCHSATKSGAGGACAQAAPAHKLRPRRSGACAEGPLSVDVSLHVSLLRGAHYFEQGPFSKTNVYVPLVSQRALLNVSACVFNDALSYAYFLVSRFHLFGRGKVASTGTAAMENEKFEPRRSENR